MRSYRIFKSSNPEDVKQPFVAVKNGRSWVGFFYTFIWAATRKMWGVSLCLLIPFVASIFLTASHEVILSKVVALGTSVVVYLWGNEWRCDHLRKLGYTDLGVVDARSKAKATAMSDAWATTTNAIVVK